MWIFAALLVALVLFQAGLFLRLCRKEAQAIHYPQKDLKSGFKIGMITALGPSLSNVCLLYTSRCV